MIKDRRELGQSMIIMAVAILALIALAALIIDGGSIYLNRRRAQTAADAAALAGAHMMCVDHGSLGQIQAIANQYAVTENGATAVESADIDADGQVVVQTRVESPSFFASVLGYDTDMARAEAAAGCFKPSSTANLLPVAWTCRPPVGGSIEVCSIHSIPWEVFQELLVHVQFGNGASVVLDPGDGVDYQTYYDGQPGNQKMAYLVMDKTVDTATDCAPPFGTGTIICDLNGDGILDVTGNNERGWLALDGTGAKDLVDLILNGYPDPLTLPQWFPGKSGAATDVFIRAHQIQGHLVLVPVFNGICPSTTETQIPTTCAADYQAGDLIRSASGSKDWYRVAGFAPFVVTCVSKGASEHCPAKTYSKVKNSISTIEGYFVSGYVGGTEICPECFDLGVYIISLTR
jgi:Flp pilus assembly protein TadG